MRSRTLTILALAASAVCLGANAQEEKAGPDIEANRALDARFFKALEAMDLETLAASYSKSEMVTSVSEPCVTAVSAVARAIVGARRLSVMVARFVTDTAPEKDRPRTADRRSVTVSKDAM